MKHGDNRESLFIKFLLAVVVASCGYAFSELRDQIREAKGELLDFKKETKADLRDISKDLHKWQLQLSPLLNAKR